MAKETLWDQLCKIFPEVLPQDVSLAINGTKLLELVRPKLIGKFSDDSIRGYFSGMSQNQGTSIAKKSGGNGYYLRAESPQLATENGNTKETEMKLVSAGVSDGEGRDET